MFTPTELESIPHEFEGIFATLEQDILTDIVRRIRINGEITRVADWRIYRLHELGKSKREIKKYIKTALNLSSKEINHLFKDAVRQGYTHDEQIYKVKGNPIIPFAVNKPLQQFITAVAEQTADTLTNITQSMGFAVKKGNTTEFLPIADYYQRTLDQAMTGILTGTFDYNTTIKRVVAELTNSGLRTVDYASGWSNRIPVAARRAIMTGVTQVASRINDDNARQLATDSFEVSWHMGARPSHQVWQGKVYTKVELSTVCGLGTGAGLCGWNCYHNYYPFIVGVSERSYSDEWLAEQNAKENTPTVYNGREYTAYEAKQYQRQLETKLRAERQSIKLLQDGGANDSDIINARAKYRVTSAEYTRFSDTMELPQQRERVLADGLGGIGKGAWIDGETIHVGRSVGAKAKADIILLPNGNTGRIKEGSDIIKVVTFAGKGTNKEIKVASHLEKQYNVNTKEWKKVRGEGQVVCDDGKIRRAELHWFESPTTGRIKMKVKRYFDDES